MHEDSRSDSRAPPGAAPLAGTTEQERRISMIQLRRHPIRVLLLALLLFAAAACSSTGGKQEEAPASGANAGQANTPEITVQMVTHAAPGDTFWDIIRKGATAAAAVLFKKLPAGIKRAGVILSGGNIDPDLLQSIINP